MVYTQLNPPPVQSEKVSTKDLEVLDKVSITKVTDFMHKYQDDATFTPPTVEVLYDTDKSDELSVDDDADSLFMDIEDIDDEIQHARAQK